uniref:RNA helicase n=1 Tax=Cyprinus carpio TaxID=7962 RepID=A0A8C2GLE5_CYPCA
MPSLKTSYEVGLDFLEFLGQRISKTDRNELRDIYNFEFIRFATVTQSHLLSVWFYRIHSCQVLLYFVFASEKHVMKQCAIYMYDCLCVISYHCPGSVSFYIDAIALFFQVELSCIADLIKDKGGVEITSVPKATKGKVTFIIKEQGKLFVVKFHIVNRGERCVYFTYYTALHKMRCFTLVDERRVNRVSPLLLCPGESYVVEVHYKIHHQGHFPATMYFEFCPEADPPGTAKPFCIVREVEAVVQSGLAETLGPESPYNPKQNRRLRPENRILEEGVPPESFITHVLSIMVKLNPYQYPAYLKELAKHKMEDFERLSAPNYKERFHLLLHLEEIQMEVDIKKYDLYGKTMTLDKSNKKLLILKVPGVAENRPSVLRGDKLNVCLSEDRSQPITVYEGYVHSVELDRVKLGFSKNFQLPSRDDLMKRSVIVVTLVTAGRYSKIIRNSNKAPETRAILVVHSTIIVLSYSLSAYFVLAGMLVSGGVPKGHFTHIFIDEAGQAVESECIIGIAGLLDPVKGQLVLAGDPQQLGPILRSPLAQLHGLGQSLLERLMTQNALYQKSQDGHSGYDTRFVTKLLRNYRSHPAILKIPNELFYENELQVFANQMEREAFCCWEHLPKKGFPVMFHGVMGKDDREANSPSFFNVTEIEVIVSYLNKLMQTQGKKGLPKLSANDIGIITPYRKQVEKIRKALNTVAELNKWKEIKVGSVEEFQGQERRVIIVSTVRSSVNYVKMDQDFNIGFLSNEKRFNVAMTRAKALLVVVGNPVILSKDPTWQRFIRYCELGQGYTGFDYKDAEGEEDVVSRLASLKISSDDIDESPLQQHVHPEWRSEQ